MARDKPGHDEAGRCPGPAFRLIPAADGCRILEDMMADHAEVEYATADGNDYAEHEGTYLAFLHLTVVLTLHVINILLGLAIGGVMDHWLTAFVVFVIGAVASAHGLLSGSKTSSYVAFALCLAAFAFSAA